MVFVSRRLRLHGVIAAGMILATAFSRRSVSAEAPAAELPIQRVVLYSSGVGFFERQGKVTGDETIELRFSGRDINDLLKSLVLEDLDGGQVAAVSYSARNPIGQTLKTFSVDLTGEPTLAELLRQVRGERVVVTTQEGEKRATVEGVIASIEQRKQVAKNGTQSVTDVLILLADDGLRTVPLDAETQIQLRDDKLNAELAEALSLLAQARATDKKTVVLRCKGKGERTLRVGYIQETPVWKTSYRLVLRDKEKPHLQGWAIVENMGDHDWKDVKLSLVSGRPVSFIMDLYQPLYAGRPTVEPDFFAGLRPRQHGQDLMEREKVARGASGGFGGGIGGGARGLGGGFFGGGGAMGGMGGAIMPPAAPAEQPDENRLAEVPSTAPSAARGGDIGELFRYAILTPVTLDRQKSAMLPIVNEAIAGEKVGIFNPETDATHPLNAFHLENTTALHLMQGPISVFDGGEYAGDAQIADVAPGARRLISYALDLDTEVVKSETKPGMQLTGVAIVDGYLKTFERVERTCQYRLKNSGDQAKTILVEQPIDNAWQLKTPAKPTEQSRHYYRFAVDVPAGGSANLMVVETRDQGRSVALLELGGEQITFYLNGKLASDELKASLVKLQGLQQVRKATDQRLSSIQSRRDEIVEEQSRIRANMRELDRTSELYQRYVRKFGEQETTLEALRVEQATAEKAAQAAIANLDRFVAELNIE